MCAFLIFEVVHEHDHTHFVFASYVVLQSANERRSILQFFPLYLVQQLCLFLVDHQHVITQICRVFEFNNMQTIFESDVLQLIGRPVFGVDRLEEFDNTLVVLCFCGIGSSNEEGDPVVSASTVEMGCMEIVSVHEVAAFLVNVDDHVDLIASIDVLLLNASEGQPDQSSLFVKSSICGFYSVMPQPGELAQYVFVSIIESLQFVEVVNFLPIFIGVTLVKDLLVNFQQGSFLSISVIIKLIAVFQ